MTDLEDLSLCYVEGTWAYFTTQSLEEQWGDDWDDTPYEHNAGHPYKPCWHNKLGSNKRPCYCMICQKEWVLGGEEIKPKWKIEKIAFDAGLVPPCHNHRNSPYSVEDINREKEVPWLHDPYTDTGVEIWAGESIKSFKEKIFEFGGSVFVPVVNNNESVFVGET